MKRDYYEVLGVARDAGTDELKKAYRKLAMELHPDRNPGNKAAEEQFKEAAEAYSVLSDAEKRKVYDQFGHAGLGAGNGGGQQFQFDPNQFAGFEDILGNIFGGGLFGDIFGGGGRRRSGGEERGSDLQYTLKISFRDAVFGKDAVELSIPRLEGCGTCQGTGCEVGTKAETCPGCRGAGQVAVRQGPFQMLTTCPRCEGRGRIIPKPCRECRGEGRVHKKSKVSFKVPAGVDRGSRLRIQNQGEAGRSGGRAGDLYVVFDVEPDARYERDGVDLHQVLEVQWPLLVLGGMLEVETLYGKENVKLSTGTPAGHKIRVANAGVPRLQGHGHGRGDLWLHVQVAVPKSLDSEQRELVERLRRSFAGEPLDGEEGGFLSKVFGPEKGSKKK